MRLMCECCPVWALQLSCWKLLSKRQLYVVIQQWLLVQQERLIHVHVHVSCLVTSNKCSCRAACATIMYMYMFCKLYSYMYMVYL